MSPFLSGALAMGYLVAGVFFLRFWRDTRDRLFLLFAFSFWVLAAQRAALALAVAPENHAYLYLGRLAAFVLILIAMWDKNRQSR